MSGRQHRFLRIISGQDRSPLGFTVRPLLWPLSLGYSCATRLHHRLYDWQLRESIHAVVPVISIGNVTTGGTGKTPFVAMVTQWLIAHGFRPGILSRGYGSVAGDVNDEYRVLALCCPQTPHVQNPDRIAGARQLVDEHAVQVIVLDDGFQHRRMNRDLDVVLIDATCPWGHGHSLPRGLLREPLSALRRADVIALTRVDQVNHEQIESIRQRIKRYSPAPILECSYPPRVMRNSRGETASLSSLDGRRIFAFCGIGNPDSFRRTIEQSGATIAGFHAFADHHAYTDRDLQLVREMNRDIQTDLFVTTVKDLVKIPQPAIDDRPLWAIDIAARISLGFDELEDRLNGVVAQIPDQFADLDHETESTA